MFIQPNIKAICFDAFGTLVDITEKRWPYRALLQAMEPEAALTLKDRVMREPLALEDCMVNHASALPMETMHELKQSLVHELASIQLRPHITDLWAYLKQQGYKIAICSNLALPYGPALLKVLPAAPDVLILSYEAGFIKPEAEIYQLVCDETGFAAQDIFFTGDTELADVKGPKAFGMEAELIDVFVTRFLARKSG